MTLNCAACPVRDSAACAVLTDQERSALAQAGTSRTLRRSETLFHAGDTENACATLISGALKVCTTDADGTEHILALIHPAGFIGELFSPFAAHDVIALGESTLCVFARSNMERAVEQYPALARALLRRSQEDLHSSRELLALTGMKSAEDKVSGLLISLAHAASDSPCHPAKSFDLPLTRGEIANLLGLTIETVSRQLSTLEKSGQIARRGTRGIDMVNLARP